MFCKVDEDGVWFCSYFDGWLMMMMLESTIVIQEVLGSDIMMFFDICLLYFCMD